MNWHAYSKAKFDEGRLLRQRSHRVHALGERPLTLPVLVAHVGPDTIADEIADGRGRDCAPVSSSRWRISPVV